VERRLTVEETWQHMESGGAKMPRSPDGKPFIPAAMPAYDDEELGFSFFRTGLEDGELHNLSLPRTFFGRSGFTRVSFENTDLSGSCMCWNDFTNCDFSGADLTGCDMRASVFADCVFDGAILRGANLERSTFEGCTFKGADLTKAIADAVYGDEYGLIDTFSDEQSASMKWNEEAGPEPSGG
jgi:hypothetical protein